MKMELSKRKPDLIVPPSPAAIAKFGRFKSESEEAVRKCEVVKNPVPERLISAWKGYGKTIVEERDPSRRVWEFTDMEIGMVLVARYTYEGALCAVSGIAHTIAAKEVEAFSIAMADFPREEDIKVKSGFFLSALLNSGKGRNYVLRLAALEEKPDNLCHRNEKNVIIHGDVGDGFGYNLRGRILVKGDVGNGCAKHMMGGRLTIEGNAGHSLGVFMSGGQLIVKGDTKAFVGSNMNGGSIRVYGRPPIVERDMEGGLIFHRRTLIDPKLGI